MGENTSLTHLRFSYKYEQRQPLSQQLGPFFLVQYPLGNIQDNGDIHKNSHTLGSPKLILELESSIWSIRVFVCWWLWPVYIALDACDPPATLMEEKWTSSIVVVAAWGFLELSLSKSSNIVKSNILFTYVAIIEFVYTELQNTISTRTILGKEGYAQFPTTWKTAKKMRLFTSVVTYQGWELEFWLKNWVHTNTRVTMSNALVKLVSERSILDPSQKVAPGQNSIIDCICQKLID